MNIREQYGEVIEFLDRGDADYICGHVTIEDAQSALDCQCSEYCEQYNEEEGKVCEGHTVADIRHVFGRWADVSEDDFVDDDAQFVWRTRRTMGPDFAPVTECVSVATRAYKARVAKAKSELAAMVLARWVDAKITRVYADMSESSKHSCVIFERAGCRVVWFPRDPERPNLTLTPLPGDGWGLATALERWNAHKSI